MEYLILDAPVKLLHLTIGLGVAGMAIDELNTPIEQLILEYGGLPFLLWSLATRSNEA